MTHSEQRAKLVEMMCDGFMEAVLEAGGTVDYRVDKVMEAILAALGKAGFVVNAVEVTDEMKSVGFHRQMETDHAEYIFNSMALAGDLTRGRE